MRDKAQGKSPEYLAVQLGQARWWQREAGLLGYGPSAAEEADEWERISELVRTQGLAAYDVDLDKQAQVWIAEYQDVEAAQRAQTGRLRRVEAGQRLTVELSAGAQRRLVALAGELGVSAERVLEVLAEGVESGGEGLVRVPATRVSPSP
ncbi:hypothetical protein [Kitasatospora sp. NPDC001175]|uniref:hypothetical protein n=1 Tax=Kitasatospora sp. NPDC001175 TaxID=3157103 RepID=UPI003D08E0B4